MYSYETFETLGVFTLLRPVFWTILLMTLLLFLGVIIPKVRKKLINGVTVLSLSFILVFISAQLLFFDGIIVDELGLGGDSVSFYLFLAIAGFSIANILICLLSRVKKS